jgi:hypothetical protein
VAAAGGEVTGALGDARGLLPAALKAVANSDAGLSERA